MSYQQDISAAQAAVASLKRWISMPERVDLYNAPHGNAEIEVYSEIRREAYGVDLGQTSWVSADELAQIPDLLHIDSASNVVEIGSGVGGCAMRFALTIECRVTGIDVNRQGIQAAEYSAQILRIADRARFLEHDASKRLPFPDQAFDAAYSNDAFCHIPNRLALLRECRRVLKRGGRLLFSDALIVNGALSNEEIAARSAIGRYLLVPRGENERLIQEAGFTLVRVQDTTQQAAAVAQRWHDARARRKTSLLKIEGEANFDGLQRFLACVHKLTAENRLARFVYVAVR